MKEGAGTTDRTLALPSDELLERLAPLRPMAGAPDVLAHQAPDVFALWEAWEEESGRTQPPPFWGCAWPAARVLAGCLRRGEIAVAGRRVLEIGCGGAVAAIVAALAGAQHVEANDIDPVALHVAARNAIANSATLQLSAADASSSALPAADLILVADLFYEQAGSGSLAAALRARAANGTDVVVADAGRAYAPRADLTLLHVETVDVDRDLEGVPSRAVRVFRLAPRPNAR